jgi:branched-chain amino acid transport system permease protein
MAGLTFSRYVVVGVLLILVIIFLPRGLVDLPNRLQEWRKGRNQNPAQDQASGKA